MDKEMLNTLLSGEGIVFVGGVGAALWWIVSRIMSYQGKFENIDMQFKNVEVRFQSLEEKMDRGFKHLEDKIDIIIKNLDHKIDIMVTHLDDKINTVSQEERERISRLEKYFDIIMKTQIEKNSEKFEMSSK